MAEHLVTAPRYRDHDNLIGTITKGYWMYYIPRWEQLTDALARVVRATGLWQTEAQTNICRAIENGAINFRAELGTYLYGGTLLSRLNDKRYGPIVVVMQRLHENDLAGHLLAQGSWEHLVLPPITIDDTEIAFGGDRTMHLCTGDILHPERENKEALERIREEIGSLMFSAQYQQQPVPLEGNIVRQDWFRNYDELPQATAVRTVQSWDIAMATGTTNDYSVCTTWQMIKDDYHLIDVFRGRLQYPDLRRKVASLADKHRS